MILHPTIAAIATPVGTGGISVIRVSGDDAISVCDRIFSAKNGKKLINAKSHTLHYGHICKDDTIVDEVLISVMRAPHTFTGEDTCEINCHGGVVVTEAVLSLVIQNGATLASAGEFTKRAFLNGKLDLSQAEAVIDTINSPSQSALYAAANQLDGELSRKINAIRDNLLEISAKINANIDYPEEDLEEYTTEELLSDLKQAKQDCHTLLETAHRGKLLKDGINTVICGRPNVGKSSLLNLLCRDSRAIVTDIAGTTRDVIEERVSLGSIVLNLFDTAGIRAASDEIEKIGIQKSLEHVKEADLVLFLFDGARGFTEEDQQIYNTILSKNHIVIQNKTDLATTEKPALQEDILYMSVKNGDGLSELSQRIENLFRIGALCTESKAIITNLRHKEALTNAYDAINRAEKAFVSQIPYDMASVDITQACTALGEITGKTVSEEVTEKIFSRFCVGK